MKKIPQKQTFIQVPVSLSLKREIKKRARAKRCSISAQLLEYVLRGIEQEGEIKTSKESLALSRAINQAGSMAALAQVIVEKTGKKVSIGSIQYWKQSRVPAKRVLDLEAATGIPRHEFRPDIYPTDSSRT